MQNVCVCFLVLLLTLRAVETLVARVAGAHVVLAALALSRAVVRAGRGGDADHGGSDENLGDRHF